MNKKGPTLTTLVHVNYASTNVKKWELIVMCYSIYIDRQERVLFKTI